jgi:hypothetical protein
VATGGGVLNGGDAGERDCIHGLLGISIDDVWQDVRALGRIRELENKVNALCAEKPQLRETDREITRGLNHIDRTHPFRKRHGCIGWSEHQNIEEQVNALLAERRQRVKTTASG